MKSAFAALCLAFLPLVSHAAAPTAESIEQLMTVTNSEKLVEGSMPQIERMTQNSLEQVLAGQKMSAEQRRKADAFVAAYMAKVRPMLRDELGWENMKPLYVQIYSESFTQEEVDGLLAFYRSPAGKALVEKMPVVMQKTFAVVQQRLVPLMEATQKIATETLQEMKQNGGAKK